MAFDPTGEEWRPVVGYEGVYEVSNLGRVRRATDRRGGRSSGSFLALHIRRGRNRANLGRDGVVKKVMVAHLVAAAFLGPCPEGCEVAHNDGNSANDNVCNLRYATRLENVHDKYKHGTMGRKLDPDKVRVIRALIGEATQREIAKTFGISQTMVSFIQRGVSWGVVK